MIEIYLLSIVIWAIIIFCVTKALAFKIAKNGWLDGAQRNSGGWITMFIVAAIPIFRILVASTIVYMSVYTRQQYEDIKKEYDEDEEK